MARERNTPTGHSACEDLPLFDLTFEYDDEDDPSEVTVFPAGETCAQTTTWLSVDVDDAIPVEDVR